MFLRIGETVRSAQFARFVDVDREPTRHLFSADLKALDLRTAPRLALPGCGDAPARFGFCGVLPDALDQGEQIADIDAVTTGVSRLFILVSMKGSFAWLMEKVHAGLF